MYSSQRSQAFELATTAERQRGWGTGQRNALGEKQQQQQQQQQQELRSFEVVRRQQ